LNIIIIVILVSTREQVFFRHPKLVKIQGSIVRTMEPSFVNQPT